MAGATGGTASAPRWPRPDTGTAPGTATATAAAARAAGWGWRSPSSNFLVILCPANSPRGFFLAISTTTEHVIEKQQVNGSQAQRATCSRCNRDAVATAILRETYGHNANTRNVFV